MTVVPDLINQSKHPYLLASAEHSEFANASEQCIFQIVTDYRGCHWKGITVYNATEVKKLGFYKQKYTFCTL